MNKIEYWSECISCAADECGLSLTKEQLNYIAESVKIGHECFGLAFYSPPATDRIAQIGRENDLKYKKLETQFEKYKNDAELAVKRALHLGSNSNISINEGGEVTLWGGRAERIQ